MDLESIHTEYFDHIVLPVPKEKIYSRLGYAKGITKLDDKQSDAFEGYIEEALEFIDLKGAGAIIPIDKVEPSKVILRQGTAFESESLAKFLTGSKEILLIAATSGSKIVEAISESSAGKDVTAAVIFDAVAGEMADSALSWIMHYFNRRISRQGRQLTPRRFSAGYGDFSLENQKIIYDILKLKRLGISLSDDYMLIPEKSVTAVAGVEQKG